MRCETQECGKYQPCRMFIENTLAVEITMSAVKTQAAIFKSKFGVNQHDKVLRKQQSLGLRLKKLFPNENIIEEYFALHYRTDFTFKKHMLVEEINAKGHVDRDPDFEMKRKKQLEILATTLLELIVINLVSCYKSKMKTYCVKCRKDTENIDPKMVWTKNNRLIMQLKCPVCGIKKSRFVKEQEAKGLLSNLGNKTPLSKIP